MSNRPGPTIGVLSTWFGGSYFGGLLAGIAAQVAAENGRLVAIQTLDAGTFGRDFLEPPPFPHRVAWNHVSGFIVILNAATGSYLTAAQESGRPVVVISNAPSGFRGPMVFPDNFSGSRAATAHLIEHGHTRIAYVGYRGQKDVRERYQAHCDTMTANGLAVDPDLFYPVDDMQESGGEAAGRAMLAAGLPSTAVMTGNDQNAVGLIRALTAGGLRLPTDQALVGFDDIEIAANLTPSLTTVRQPLEDIGHRATRLLTRMIAGEPVPPEVHQVATTLTVRESCGCTDPLSLATVAVEAGAGATDTDELLTAIRRALPDRPSDHRTSAGPDHLPASVAGIAAALQAAIDGTAASDGLELRRTLDPLSALIGGNENAVEVAWLIRHFGRHRQIQAGADRDVDVTRRVEDCLNHISFRLAQSQTSRLARDAKSMMTSLATQNLISMDLLRSQERDPRSLDWLGPTQVRGGCLGLWPPATADEPTLSRLNVIRIFDRETGSRPGPPGLLDLASFPPTPVLELADIAQDDMVYVAHLKVDPGDWGMLALVGPIDAYVEEGRETMNQWAALLSVALEHEAVLKTMREQEEHLRRAALYDGLTGLPNRTCFRERLTVAMARAGRRPDYRYAVLMLDLDGFKRVNDSLGHLAGDRLLRQVADRLTENVRVIDTPARFGGDEFAILLEEIKHESDPVVLATRLQAALVVPHDLGDTEVVVSASIGIALGRPEYDDTETVMRDADAAMYHAKMQGKRAYAVFDPSMHEAVVDRLRLEGELRAALEAAQFVLHYQPIVDLGTGRADGVEALVRWQHPTRGLLAPAQFLPVAEESGLILGLSAWVLAEACAELRAGGLEHPGPHPFRLSVNVSNRQFWHTQLVDDVEDELHRHGLDPRGLAIEITEGVIMHDVKLAASMLAQLKTLGIQVHVDDFGTGYSSLEALHDLPIDALKIDRSFVGRLGTSARSRELVRTIVTMGRNLDLDVIAEGIETAVEEEILQELGCTHGQGYRYSRPVPGPSLRAVLAQF